MASQEFLASFAVEIDEGGVSRLQAVLEQNRELADSLAAAFNAASAAIHAFAEALGICRGISFCGREPGRSKHLRGQPDGIRPGEYPGACFRGFRRADRGAAVRYRGTVFAEDD